MCHEEHRGQVDKVLKLRSDGVVFDSPDMSGKLYSMLPLTTLE